MYAHNHTLGHFAGPALLILYCLKDGAEHAHAIIERLDEQSGVVLEPGTFYAALARLERRDWIRPLENLDSRRAYCLTDHGYAILDQSLTTIHEKLIYRMLAEYPHL